MKIEDIVLVATFLIAAGLILWYIFGSSPTMDQISLGVSLLNFGFIFKVHGDLQRHLGEHKGSWN